MSLKFILLLGVCQVCYVHADLTFRSFQKKYNKTYLINSDLTRRERIFNETLANIEKHNKKYELGLVSYKMGVNQFSDLSDEEFASRSKTLPLNDTFLGNTKTLDASFKLNTIIPESIDWREEGVVTSVKNQESCGSCWAFATTGALESQLAIKYGNLTTLSEQQLMDCSTANYGCDGGVIQYAIDYVAKYGITTDKQYPYKARKGSCDSSKSVVARAKGYYSISRQNEQELKIAVGTVGPVAVAVYSGPIKSYKSGIFSGSCSEKVDHGVLVVGYGTENGINYWIIKNSWGADWGEDGYYRMVMGQGLCGITNQACYPYGVELSNGTYVFRHNHIFNIFTFSIIVLLFFIL